VPHDGIAASTGSVGRCSGLLLANNHIQAGRGINLTGRLERVAVLGNVVRGAVQAGIQLENLADTSAGVLIANNTVLDCLTGLRFWDDEPFVTLRPAQFQVFNNLILDATQFDVGFIRSHKNGEHQGETEEVTKQLTFACNFRDLSGSYAGSQMLLHAQDRKLGGVPFLSRDAVHPDFVRPPPDSPLATGGAGKDDPSLPTYVGAIPPKGTPAWDWNKTWRWRMNKAAAPAKAAEKP
jgi:hypothetical protein